MGNPSFNSWISFFDQLSFSWEKFTSTGATTFFEIADVNVSVSIELSAEACYITVVNLSFIYPTVNTRRESTKPMRYEFWFTMFGAFSD